jgi:thiamine-phosphate pyrophosphorylase
MPDHNLFVVIGQSFDQLVITIYRAQHLCKQEEKLPRMAHRLLTLYEKLLVEEKLLKSRFNLPVLGEEYEQIAAQEEPAHDYRPAEIHRLLRKGQELCRALEEYFHFFSLENLALSYRKMRLDLYGLERKLVDEIGESRVTVPDRVTDHEPKEHDPGNAVAAALKACPLYFIMDDSMLQNHDPVRAGLEAVQSGVRMIQLRFKNMETREYLRIAYRYRAMSEEHKCLLIINDRLDIALVTGADGVHVGDKDFSVDEIRNVAPDIIIGSTARTVKDAVAAQEAGADYIGVGSVYGSRTKPGLPVITPRGLSSMVKAVKIPVTAIGGITFETCSEVLEAGALGFSSIRPFTTMRSTRMIVKEFLKAAGRLTAAREKT